MTRTQPPSGRSSHPRLHLLRLEEDIPTLKYRRPQLQPCECPSPAHCLEALGGEQGLTAEELELAALRRELANAREALGPGWFVGNASLADAIRRKTRLLESLQRPRRRTRQGEG